MANDKYRITKNNYIPASEWLKKTDEFSRWEFHPLKPTKSELEQLHKTMEDWEVDYALQRIEKAREAYKREQWGFRKKKKFISEQTGVDYSTLKGLSKTDIQTAYKGIIKQRAEQGERAHIDDLYWYMNVMKWVGIDQSYIDRMYAIQDELTPAELDMLYAELPELSLYYQSTKPGSKDQTTTHNNIDEWQKQLDKTLTYYENMVKNRPSQEDNQDNNEDNKE